MKIFYNLLVALISLALLIEGTSVGLTLVNLPSDLAVFGGSLLFFGTVIAFLLFTWKWWIAPNLSKFDL